MKGNNYSRVESKWTKKIPKEKNQYNQRWLFERKNKIDKFPARLIRRHKLTMLRITVVISVHIIQILKG